MTQRVVLLCLLVLPIPLALTPAASAGDNKRAATSVLENGEFTAELNGLKLWYKVSGRGPVCLMPTPAWGPSSDLYFRTLQPLEKTFTMVYLDTRASGRSQPANSTREYTWDHLVADIEALRAHLKQEKVWLMGHSEGGEQVLFYAVKHPKRVNGMVLLATRAAMDAKQRADIRERVLSRKNESWFKKYQEAEKKIPANDEEYAEKMRALAPMKFARPERIVKLREASQGNRRPYSLEAGKGSVDSGRDRDYDLTGRLKKVTAPALIVVGAADVSYSPFAAQRMHLALQNSKLLLIEDAGHFPWLEQPEAFFDGMSAFLASLTSNAHAGASVWRKDNPGTAPIGPGRSRTVIRLITDERHSFQAGVPTSHRCRLAAACFSLLVS